MAIQRLIVVAGLVASALAAQPAAAYMVQPTGRTLATPQLVADVVNRISAYSKSTDGCAFVFSVNMAVMGGDYRPVQPTAPVARLGGHYERWTVNACAAKQVFQVAMWPSPQGGSDFAILPVTGRMPLTTR